MLCTVAVFSLQGLWIRSLYRAYPDQTMSVVEKAMRASIGKELSFRNKERPFKDLKNPKVVYKYGKVASVRIEYIDICIKNNRAQCTFLRQKGN